tara:strand:- start:570 stop:1019 length:450 start_codon:yes stop_codon:yes gene_type:complete
MIMSRVTIFVLFGMLLLSNPSISGKTNKFGENQSSTLQLLGHLSKKELKATMKFYSKSLGQKCSFCHVKDKSVDLNDSITNPKIRQRLKHKEIARQMIRMTQEINEKYLSWKHSGGRKADQVNCMLCHRGNKSNLLRAMEENMALLKHK